MKLGDLKKIKIGRVVYPSILVVFFIFVFAVIYKTIEFSKIVVNGIFLNDNINQTYLMNLNIKDYKVLANKLSIPQPEIDTSPANNTVTTTKEFSESSITTSTEFLLAAATTTTSTATTNKQSLKIVVFNGSGKNGLAGKLENVLVSSGYPIVSTGNFGSRVDKTSISSKVNIGADELVSLVKSYYPSAEYDMNLSPTSSEDVVIVIGRN